MSGLGRRVVCLYFLTGLHLLAVETRASDQAASKSEKIVWAGLDYSMVRMIGSNDFRVPDMIFPGMLEKWNTLFLDERIDLVANAVGKKVAVDISSVTERNSHAFANQIVTTPGDDDVIGKSHLTTNNIQEAVRSYQFRPENQSGTGLVFIIDRLIEKTFRPNTVGGRQGSSLTISHPAEGAVYVVLFDIDSRRLISVKREINRTTSGANFRNFWFGPIKDADKSLHRLDSGDKKYSSSPAAAPSTGFRPKSTGN
jgi:hypothetical protein